jgi:hypothetical protein
MWVPVSPMNKLEDDGPVDGRSSFADLTDADYSYKYIVSLFLRQMYHVFSLSEKWVTSKIRQTQDANAHQKANGTCRKAPENPLRKNATGKPDRYGRTPTVTSG